MAIVAASTPIKVAAFKSSKYVGANRSLLDLDSSEGNLA